MSRYTWSEDRIGNLTAVIRRSRYRHYSIRIYRGCALAAIFSSLNAYLAWKAGWMK
jgi:hypothetical protein